MATTSRTLIYSYLASLLKIADNLNVNSNESLTQK